MNGFQNEFDFIISLNNKKLNELNPLLQELILYLFKNINKNDVIKSWKNHLKQKSDIFIKVNNKIKRISIKEGSRNSVHVESVTSFKYFLKKNYLSNEDINTYMNYHIGKINDVKVSAEEYKKFNQHNIDKLNEKFKDPQLLINVINRFILKGNIFNDNVDVLIHGTPNDFLWISQSEVFIILLSKINDYKTAPHFGPLVIQPLSRCLNENQKYEYTQGYIQVKWYSLLDDIIEYKTASRYLDYL